MIEDLQTERGQFAERAWNQFCWHETVDAWRTRTGGRIIKEGPLTPALLQSAFQHDKPEKIERVVIEVLKSFTEPLLQKLASLAWLTDQRPDVDGAESLASFFPEKSPSQIRRAVKHIDRQLARALLSAPDLHWSKDMQLWLGRLSGKE